LFRQARAAIVGRDGGRDRVMEQPIFPAIYPFSLIPHLLAGRDPGMRVASNVISSILKSDSLNILNKMND
jgi:hypothetical protein